MAGCGFGSPEASGAPPAWLQPWERRKAITLAADQIEAPGDGALVDFPVLVSVTDAEIGGRALADGSDIVFTSADGTTVLASEIESFSLAGQLVAWVKVPALSAVADTRLYVYYGSATPPSRVSEAVWTADYLAVWHLQQAPDPAGDGEILDATGNDHDGNADDSMGTAHSTSGQIGRGIRFDGTGDYIDFPAAMNVGNTVTISAWVNIEGSTGIKTILANSNSGAGVDGFRFFVNNQSTANGRILFETGDGQGNNVTMTDPGAVAPGTFAYVVAVVNRAGDSGAIFINGVGATVLSGLQDDFQPTSDFEIGRMKDSTNRFIGVMDDVSVASVLRTPEWIATAFNNQSKPTTFHTFGDEARQ